MRKKLPLACNVVSAALVIAFIVKNIVDYPRYLESYGSAPFRVWVLVNALYLVYIFICLIKRRGKEPEDFVLILFMFITAAVCLIMPLFLPEQTDIHSPF